MEVAYRVLFLLLSVAVSLGEQQRRGRDDFDLIATARDGDLGGPTENLQIRDLLQMMNISITRIEDCITLGKELSVTVQHGFYYPITYHVFPVAHPNKRTSQNAVLSNQPNLSSITTTIKLPWMNTLGPGKHATVLVLENDVSSRNLVFSLYICERPTSIYILPMDFVDVYPANFTITIQIPKGSPATIDVILLNIKDSKSLAEATTSCYTPQECRQVSIQMTVPIEGLFDIVAVASNRLGSVTSTMGLVESFVLVHYVFMTSSFPISTASPGMFFVFYKILSDLGIFQIELSADGKVFSKEYVSSHVTFEDAKNNLPNFQIPFNPTTYRVYSRSHLVVTPGKHEISVNIATKNRKQSLKSKINIIVLPTLDESCLNGVKIRDGRKERFLTEIFDGTSPIILTAAVDINCEIPDGERLEYKWKAYKAKPLDEPPDLRNKLHFINLRTDNPELKVDPRNMEPGFYLFQILVFHKNRLGSIVLQVDDFVSIKTPKFNLEARICEAYQREINPDVTEVEFDAVCSGNPLLTGIQYTWFCALSKDELPPQKDVGMFQTKGSCFEFKSPFIGKKQKIRLKLEDVKKEKNEFFVRVFLSLEGFDDAFADQRIVILSRSVPSVYIQCWSNCGREVKPSYALILHAQCDSCSSLKWSDKTTGDFTQIRPEDLQKIKGSVEASVTGADGSGSSTAVFQNRIADYPLVNIKVHPEGIVPANTKVTITCESEERLLIRFFASVKINQPYILVKYGYDKTLSDIYVFGESSQPFSYFKIEACSLNGICLTYLRAIEINYYQRRNARTGDLSVLENELAKSLTAGDTQEVVKQALQITTIAELSSKMRKKLLAYGLSAPLVSIESAKQSLDLLYYGVRTGELSDHEQKLVVNKLSDITSIVRADTDLSSFVGETFFDVMISLASNILQSTRKSKMDADASQRTLTNMLAELSKDIMRESYRAQLKHYFAPAIRSSIRRFNSDSKMEMYDNEFTVKAAPPRDKDVKFFDLMVFRFKSSVTKFKTRTGAPDEVIGVSFICSRKIPGGDKPRTEPCLLQGPILYVMKTHEIPKFSVVKLHPVAENSSSNVTVNDLWAGRRRIAVQGEQGSVTLKIMISLVHEYDRLLEFEYVRLNLKETSVHTESDFSVTKVITQSELEAGGIYTWILPLSLVGNNTFVLTIEVKSRHQIDSVKVLPYGHRCSLWDDEINDWNSKDCNSSGSLGQCRCESPKRMSSQSTPSSTTMQLFATRLVVYPNRIDFSERHRMVDEEDFHDNNTMWDVIEFEKNPIMISTVLSAYVIFALAFLFAAIKDKQDMTMPPYVEVCDNMPNERYRYLVTVFTGSRRRSAPTSTVVIKLMGNNGSVVHLLQKFGEERVLLQGSAVTFLITAPSPLGVVNTVRIWHRNEGNSPEWYLDRFVVRDYEADDCWFFPVYTWLSDYHTGECQIDITVKAASAEQLHSFRSIFSIKCQNYLKDRHMWYSVFAMHPWSIHDMTRTQRVASCMLLVFMVMATSLAFFRNESSVAVDLGFYSFKWSDIAVGMQTGALCFPMTFLVTLIFRSSRKRHHISDHGVTSLVPFQGNSLKRSPDDEDQGNLVLLRKQKDLKEDEESLESLESGESGSDDQNSKNGFMQPWQYGASTSRYLNTTDEKENPLGEQKDLKKDGGKGESGSSVQTNKRTFGSPLPYSDSASRYSGNTDEKKNLFRERNDSKEVGRRGESTSPVQKKKRPFGSSLPHNDTTSRYSSNPDKKKNFLREQKYSMEVARKRHSASFAQKKKRPYGSSLPQSDSTSRYSSNTDEKKNLFREQKDFKEVGRRGDYASPVQKKKGAFGTSFSPNDSMSSSFGSCQEDFGYESSARQTSAKFHQKPSLIKNKPGSPGTSERDSVAYFSCDETSGDDSIIHPVVQRNERPTDENKVLRSVQKDIRKPTESQESLEKKVTPPHGGKSRAYHKKPIRSDIIRERGMAHIRELLKNETGLNKNTQRPLRELFSLKKPKPFLKQTSAKMPASPRKVNHDRLAPYKERLEQKNKAFSEAAVLAKIEIDHKLRNKAHRFDKIKVPLPSAGVFRSSFLSTVRFIRRQQPREKPGVAVMEIAPGSTDFKPLPWIWVYIGFLVVFAVTGACSWLTIIYGNTYGLHISRKWLVSLATSIIQSIFVLEPLKAVLSAYLVVFRNPRPDITDWIPPLKTEVQPREHTNEEEVSRKLIHERKHDPSYKTPNTEEVKKDSFKRMVKRVKKRRIKDMSVHLVYLFLLCVIAFGLHDKRIFRFKHALMNMLKVNSKAWNRVKTVKNVYDWLEGPVIDNLYGGHSSHFTDGQLLVVSSPVVRQQRVGEGGPCRHASAIPYFHIRTCKSGSELEEKGTFSPGWKAYSEGINSKLTNATSSPWEYNFGDPWSLPYLGEHDNYNLGGYVARLTKDKENATNMMKHLMENNWIDRKTRVVMLETVLYNSVLRFYCVVLMSFEMPSTGKVHSSLQLLVMKSHYVITTLDSVIYFSLFSLLAMVFYYVYDIANLAREAGFEYLRDVWNVLEILTLFTSVGAVVTFLSKAMYTDLALDAMKTGRESLVLFYTASCLDYTLTCLFGYCIFFTMMRTVSLMEDHPHFRLANATFHIIRFDLPGHLFCLFIGYLAFCHSGLIMFHDIVDFSGKMRATQSIVAYATGTYMSKLLAAHPMHGGIFLLLFLIFYVKLFVNFYSVILENAFRESKLVLRNIKRQDFVTLRRKQIRSLFAIESRKKFEDEIKKREYRERIEKYILLAVLKFKKGREKRILKGSSME